jgi:ubiquinone/menaquinone biosynthesis C-methylase UbiE
MKPVDYNTQQHQNYARGRSLQPDQTDFWIRAFAERLPRRRPLDGLDLGSGTGRFAPALAAAFGPVTGVEPAAAMRRIAEAAAHPGVSYLSGSAEALPLPDGSVDYTLMFLVWHHVPDQERAAAELARVTRPGGTALLRSQFRDHMPRLWWLEYFPRGLETDAAIFQPLADVEAVFTRAGWQVADFAKLAELSAATRAETLAKLRLRSYSIFEQFTPEEAAAGFERLEAAVAADPDALVPSYPQPLLTLTRP